VSHGGKRNAREMGAMNVADELQKLEQLRQSGAINNDEFVLAKAKILKDTPQYDSGGPPAGIKLSSSEIEQQTRLWAMFLHLALLVPFVGFIVSIVIWQIQKASFPGIDVHGKNAANWIISVIIYYAICVVLVFAIIGIPLLFALSVTHIVFVITAGIKANNGEVWKYPLAITFFK
jgi:uncharacterized Tic20 family protein